MTTVHRDGQYITLEAHYEFLTADEAECVANELLWSARELREEQARADGLNAS